jgi:hypothetical protein
LRSLVSFQLQSPLQLCSPLNTIHLFSCVQLSHFSSSLISTPVSSSVAFTCLISTPFTSQHHSPLQLSSLVSFQLWSPLNTIHWHPLISSSRFPSTMEFV